MICFFYKRLISARVTEDKAMPAFVERHLSKCEECRQFLRDHSNIARRLRLEAGAGEHLFAARASQAAGNKDKRFNTIRTGRIAALPGSR
jgi:predicted anti-sigma-YlaC factor YlaD